MTDTKNNLLLFFDRPTEPCFMQKGEDRATFELPEHYYVSFSIFVERNFYCLFSLPSTFPHYRFCNIKNNSKKHQCCCKKLLLNVFLPYRVIKKTGYYRAFCI